MAKKIRKSRSLILSTAVLALLTAASLGFLAPEAEAGPSHSKEITYFASAAKVEIVGFYELTCSGTVLDFGRKTRFKEENLIPCF